jgi:outer membrane protein
MKKNMIPLLGLTLMFALLYAITNSAPSTAPGPLGSARVGFVDIPTIMERAVFVGELRRKIQTELDGKLKKYEEKKKEYARFLDELKRQESVLSEEALNAKYKEAFLLKAQLDEEKFTIDRFLKESETEDLMPAQDHILEVVHRVARDEGYEIVLRREFLIYGQPSADMTENVVARLNAAPQIPPAP